MTKGDQMIKEVDKLSKEQFINNIKSNVQD